MPRGYFAGDVTVIPGRAQRVRPEVAGPMAGSGANPESIFTDVAKRSPEFIL
jgi:hypothetical protein